MNGFTRMKTSCCIDGSNGINPQPQSGIEVLTMARWGSHDLLTPGGQVLTPP